MFGFVTDTNNYARIASIVSSSGGNVSLLQDGKIGRRLASNPATVHTFTITIPATVDYKTINFVSLHELRYPWGISSVSAEVVSEGGFAPVSTTLFERDSATLLLGEVISTGIMVVEVKVILPSSGRIELGEIVVGKLDAFSFHFRSATITDAPTIVANGDNRVMVAPSQLTYNLEYPPSRINEFDTVIASSEGGLNPVVFMPNITRLYSVYGYLENSDVVIIDENHLYNRSLQFTESRRGLP